MKSNVCSIHMKILCLTAFVSFFAIQTACQAMAKNVECRPNICSTACLTTVLSTTIICTYSKKPTNMQASHSTGAQLLPVPMAILRKKESIGTVTP